MLLQIRAAFGLARLLVESSRLHHNLRGGLVGAGAELEIGATTVVEQNFGSTHGGGLACGLVSGRLVVAGTVRDNAAFAMGGGILAMEGADPITSPAQVEHWWQLGLRSVMLAHYGKSHYAVGTGDAGPLTPAELAPVLGHEPQAVEWADVMQGFGMTPPPAKDVGWLAATRRWLGL